MAKMRRPVIWRVMARLYPFLQPSLIILKQEKGIKRVKRLMLLKDLMLCADTEILKYKHLAIEILPPRR